MKRILTQAVLLAVLASQARGHWPIVRELTCPMCGQSFTSKSVWSGFVPPPRLDLKPNDVDDIWQVPACSQCTFVLYSDKVDPNELGQCRICLQSEEYRKIMHRCTYRRLAHLYRYIGKSDYDIAMAYLRASWQEEKNRSHYMEDLDGCLTHLRRHLADNPLDGEGDASGVRASADRWHTAQLLVGEILRLQGNHEEAIRHFKGLVSAAGFLAVNHGDLVLFELDLCQNKDSKPHSCDELRGRERPDKWRVLQSYGADLNAKDDAGQTALLHAVKEKDPNSVRLLIDLGAEINPVDNSGQTALHYAIDERDEETALLLIDGGADLHTAIRKHSLSSFVGRTPLHLAARRGCLQTASMLVEKGAHVDAVDEYDATPAHFAIRYNQPKLLDFLLDRGANLHARDKKGDTLLRAAARRPGIDGGIVKNLIDRGAVVTPMIRSLLDTQRTQLHLAVEANDVQEVIALTKQEDFSEQLDLPCNHLPNSPTPLATAVSKGFVAVARVLIQHGANVNHIDSAKQTLLFHAARANNCGIARALIEGGANVNQVDMFEETPLHQAAWLGHTAMVELLLNSGADVNAVMRTKAGPNRNAGFTPLHNAALGKRPGVVKLLIANGAEVNARDAHGLTPLDQAATQGDAATFKIIQAAGGTGKCELGR